MTSNKTGVEEAGQREEGKRAEFLIPHAPKPRAHCLKLICQMTETKTLASSFTDDHPKLKQKELKVAVAKG